MGGPRGGPAAAPWKSLITASHTKNLTLPEAASPMSVASPKTTPTRNPLHAANSAPAIAMKPAALLNRLRLALLALLPGVMVSAAYAESPPVFLIRAGDLLGLINASGKIIAPPEFEELKPGDPLILVRKSARVTYLDYQGNMVIAPQDALTLPFAEGLAPMPLRDAQGKMRYGYVDAQRKTVIAPAFAHAEGFIDGLAIAGLEDAWGALKYGVIDRAGKWVVPAVYDKVLPHSGGVVRVENKGKPARLFSREGRDITPPGVDFIGIQAEGMVRIWSGRKQGYLTTGGQVAVAPRFDQASDFKEGMARVWVEGKYGFVDKTGKLTVPAKFDTAEEFSDGLALVKLGEQQMYVDQRGETVLKVEAERAYPFSEGLAVVKRGGRYGFIDKTGRDVIEARYNFARPFAKGLAFVTLGKMSGYIRPDGSFAWKSEP